MMFDEPAEPEDRPRRRAESVIDWLARSGVANAVRSRRLLRQWTCHLAPSDADDLSARFASGRDEQFHGAFLELYLHETFRRAGWRFDRHMVLPDTPNQPDFLVQTPSESTLVEATTVGSLPTAAGAERRLGRLLDTVDKLNMPNFFLEATVETVGSDDLPTAPLMKLLGSWLESMDPDEVDYDDLPGINFERHGWSIEFVALPKSPTGRGVAGDRAVGAQSTAGGIQIVDETSLRRVLANKATKYGRPTTPYVIVANDHPWDHGTSEHRVDALYGTVAMIVSGPLTGRWTRNGDGFWRRGSGWRHRRVSAVLLFSNLAPWNATDAVPELWLNPKANLPTRLRLPHWAVQRVEEVDGVEDLVVEPPLMTPGSFWA